MLTIGISTMAGTLGKVLQYLTDNSCHFDGRIEFIVCSQGENDIEDYAFSERVRVIKTVGKGLSKSRNTILNIAKTKWVWVQDDDIMIDFIQLEDLLVVLEHDSSDLAFIKIRSLEDVNLYYKDYSFHNKHHILNSLKVSSIEIIYRRDFVLNNYILFDENLGLGTKLPCCEENKFVYDCFDAKGSVSYLDISPCFHTTLLEKRSIDYKGRFLARGYLLRNFPFFYLIPLLIRWMFKIKTSDSMAFNLKLMLKGYIKGTSA